MKFIKVNMTEKDIRIEEVPQDYIGLGGRGLTSIMINAKVNLERDAL
jgi:aldehyde:ferredoxin oxidoreductase